MPDAAIQVIDSGEQTMSSTTMKAIVCDAYGDNLKPAEIERPALDADGTLVRVRAASVNPTDLHSIRGGSLIIRLTGGMRRPKRRVPGADFAGVVEAVGAAVTHVRPGDEVYGTCAGSLAEYARAGKNLVPRPRNLTFEQAASVPIAGITALQALRDKGGLQPGQSVLINGAAGGVGTFAVQIAKALGALDVTGVCSTRNVEMVLSLGADLAVDYTKEDFTRMAQRYDLVVDLVGNRSLSALRRVLKPRGTLVLSGGAHERGHGARGTFRPLLLAVRGMVVTRFVTHRIVFFIAQINPQDLLTLKDLIEAGKVTPVVDRAYALSDAAEAFRYLEKGHARGKIVVTV